MTKNYPTSRREKLATRIALTWLRATEDLLNQGIANPASLSATFQHKCVADFIGDAEHAEVGNDESDGYRIGPRVATEIEAHAKSIASQYLLNGFYPTVLVHFSAKTREAKAAELSAKADQIEANAGLNRGATPSRHRRVKQMMIGRADALRVKANALRGA